MTTPIEFEFRIVGPRTRYVQSGPYVEWAAVTPLTYRTLEDAEAELAARREDEMVTGADQWRIQSRPVVTTWEAV